MKRMILVLALVASAALSVSADNYNYLTVQKQDGSEQSFTAVGLTLTFADGNMLATQNGETTTLALSDLNKMFFSQEATGIENSEFRISNSDEVYDLQGRRIEKAGQLPKGVYIVGGKKIVVK